MSTVRAHETDWGGNNLPSDKRLSTDLALVLSVAAIIIIEIVVGSATEGTDGILGNGFPVAPLDRPAHEALPGYNGARSLQPVSSRDLIR